MLKEKNHPLSDIIDMKEPDYAQSLFESLFSNRYAILKNHPINLNNLELIYNEWAHFFKLDDDLKSKYLYSSATDDGYVPTNLEHAKDNNKSDLKEFYQIHFEKLYSTDNACSQHTKKLFKDLAVLGEELVKNIDRRLPENIKQIMPASLFESTNESKRHCMRFIHYPPCHDINELYRSAPHDDICLLTIIIPTKGEGLMIQKNNDWQKEDANPETLIVFNSEMLEVITAGYLKSMTHHVTTDLIKDAQLTSRYSMPFFVHPQSNTLLKKNLTSLAAVQQRIIDTGLHKLP